MPKFYVYIFKVIFFKSCSVLIWYLDEEEIFVNKNFAFLPHKFNSMFLCQHFCFNRQYFVLQGLVIIYVDIFVTTASYVQIFKGPIFFLQLQSHISSGNHYGLNILCPYFIYHYASAPWLCSLHDPLEFYKLLCHLSYPEHQIIMTIYNIQ